MSRAFAVSAHNRQYLPATTWRRLVWLRGVAILVQVAAVWCAATWLEMRLPWAWLAATIGVLGVSDALVWHLTARNGGPQGAFAAVLVFDLLALTALLYPTGGHTNPFVSLYLLPLAVAGTVLGRGFVWPLAALAVLAYTFLVFNYLPLPHSHLADAFDLHLAGMWASFVTGVMIVGCFFLPLAQSLRQREAELAAAREKLLRQERAAAVGAMAAGAAHELATPLSSIAILLGELRERLPGSGPVAEDLELARSQIGVCQEILTRTLRVPIAPEQQAAHTDTAALLREIVADWRALNPGCELRFDPPPVPIPGVGVPPDLLRQIAFTLFDNARDHGRGEATLLLRPPAGGKSARFVQLILCNTEAAHSDPSAGYGVGLLLATTVAESCGGRLRLERVRGGQIRAILELPIRVPAVPARTRSTLGAEHAAPVAG